MLDSIRTLTDLPASKDVRTACEDITAARQRRALQQQAQRWARDCVDQARRDAEAIHAQAFQEGYAAGILRAAENMANGLLESQALGLQLRRDLVQAARQLLGDLLSRGEWLDEMLERWLSEQPSHTGAVVQVLLPVRCKSQGNELLQRLQARWSGTVRVEYHSQERYVFRLTDQLLEFDIETTRQRLEPQLLARLSNLPESVRSLDQASMQVLSDLCSTFGEPFVRSNQAAAAQVCNED